MVKLDDGLSYMIGSKVAFRESTAIITERQHKGACTLVIMQNIYRDITNYINDGVIDKSDKIDIRITEEFDSLRQCPILVGTWSCMRFTRI